MTRNIRLAMTMVAASLTLLASVPRAQAGPPPPPSGGSGKPTPFLLFGQQSFTYYDSDWMYYGPGTLTVNPVGTDPDNGALLVTIQLMQGPGRIFYGSGVSASGKLYFSIGSYFFQCDTPGWGSYHVSGYPGSVHWVYLQ